MNRPTTSAQPEPSGRLVTFGEAMGLIRTSSIGRLDLARDAVVEIGGAEVNVAIGAARLGAPVRWTGRLGRDAVGDLIEHRLRSYGIDLNAIRDDAFTGLMLRHRRTAHVVHVDYHRHGSAGSRLGVDDDVVAGVTRGDIVHLTGITPALSGSARDACFAAVEEAGRRGATVSFDVNFRQKLWTADLARRTLLRLATRSDILFAGIEEAQLLLETAETDRRVLAAELARSGPRQVVIKEGARGCAAVIDGAEFDAPAAPAVVVDVVGAGDAFVAGYLVECLDGAPPATRLRTALEMGAYAVSVPGDCELLPSRAELAESFSTDVIR